MAKKSDNRKSFRLFNDYIEKTKMLSDEEAGQLFKAILGYVNDSSAIPAFESRVLAMAFTDIRLQLDTDRGHSEWRSGINAENGRKGGRPPIQAAGTAEPDEIRKRNEKQTEPKKPIRFSDDNHTEDQPAEKKKPESDRYSGSFKELWEIYPRKESKAAAYRNYQQRLKDGYSPEQLHEAVRNYVEKCRMKHTPREYTLKLRTFLDVSGSFTEYLPKEEQAETDTDKQSDGYEEVDFRKYM